MAKTPPLAYSHVVLENHAELASRIHNGELEPVFLWHFFLPISLLIPALLVPYQRGGRYVRPVVFLVIVSIYANVFRSRRMLLGGNGYMVGVIGTWWLVWSATLLFFNDVERDFRRVERSRLDHRKNQLRNHVKSQPTEVPDILVWQPYPQSFSHRLNWTLGLVLCMRGPEWNWRIPSSIPLPPQIETGRKEHPSTRKPCPNAKARLQAAFRRFVIAYLLLDIVKFLMIRDPYFVHAGTPPAPFPFHHLASIPGLTRFYRLFLSGFGIYLALQYVTALNPLFFLGLSLAFPNAARAVTSTPLDAPWLYADTFGPFPTPILDKGLAGIWGQWWHQLFRFGFSSTAKWTISILPAQISARRYLRRIVTTLVGFATSGLVHACGRYTQFTDTGPGSDTFLFFIMQGVGVVLEECVWARAVVPRLFLRRDPAVPGWLRRTGNGVFVFVWLLLSGGLIVDEFARGRLWVTEPLPVSLIRGLRGEGWWCWKGPWFEYYDDGTFWGRGLRVI